MVEKTATISRKKKTVLVLTMLGLCLFAFGYEQWGEEGLVAVIQNNDHLAGDERVDGGYFTLYDKENHVAIDYISRNVSVGDEIITGDNKHYRIVSIEGDDAYCELLEDGRLLSSNASAKDTDSTSVATDFPKFQSVAIYCTHTDESYVPTSGTESKNGGGDILDVAQTIVDALEAQGVQVIHSDNIHDPHDSNAYQRSRKTAAQLLQEAPAAMIDVHRDGVPDPAYYETELDGQPATQIRLVVGRQNQNSEANIEFAEKMKAYYDEVKPGLIKSIYMAKGNYNQDLAPNSVLLEVGTHTNSLDQAETGAKEFAEALPQFLGIATNENPGANATTANEEAGQQAADKKSGGTTKAILWLVGLAVVGGLGFVWISRGTLRSK